MIDGKLVKNLTRSKTPCLVQPQSSITSYYFSSGPILQYRVHEAKRPGMAKLGVQHRATGEASYMHSACASFFFFCFTPRAAQLQDRLLVLGRCMQQRRRASKWKRKRNLPLAHPSYTLPVFFLLPCATLHRAGSNLSAPLVQARPMARVATAVQ